MEFRLLTPEREIFSGEADLVSGTSEEGSFGMLARHLPSLMELQIAPVKIKGGEGEKKFSVYGGFLRNDEEDIITVFAQEAKSADEVDPSDARKKIEDLETRLEEGVSDQEERERLKQELKKAETDLAVAQND